MKAIKIIILSIFLLATFSKCEFIMDIRYSLIIRNNTNHLIDIYIVQDNLNGSIKPYPDTLLPKMKTYINKRNKEVPILVSNIEPNMWFDESSAVSWDKTIKKLPKDTLSIFIFHSDTLNKYSWEEVRDDYKILKRYDLSIQDLEKLDFNVPYPPSPEMSEMKMYPKYP